MSSEVLEFCNTQYAMRYWNFEATYLVKLKCLSVDVENRGNLGIDSLSCRSRHLVRTAALLAVSRACSSKYRIRRGKSCTTRATHIVAKCPGMAGTVPEFGPMSRPCPG